MTPRREVPVSPSYQYLDTVSIYTISHTYITTVTTVSQSTSQNVEENARQETFLVRVLPETSPSGAATLPDRM